MLASLFKPAWKSSSVEKRLRAVSTMDGASAEKQLILSKLAADDVDMSIQIAAIHKLTSAGTLHELSLKLSNELAREEAGKRLDELIGSGSSLNEQHYSDLLQGFPALSVRIAAQAVIGAVRTEIIQNLAADQLLAVLELTTFTDSRQQITERLTNLEALESARKILRGKDKKAERIIKTKIDDIRRVERQQAENLAIVEKLIEEVEYLIDHDWLPEFKARLMGHRSRWDSLDFDVDETLNQRYKVTREIIDRRYEEQKIIEETRQAQQDLVGNLESFLREVANRDLGSSITALAETLNSQQQFATSWQQLVAKTRPHLIIVEQYDNMLRALQSATKLVSRAGEILQPEEATDQLAAELTGEASTTGKLEDNSKKLSSALKSLKWNADFTELMVATELQCQLANWRKQQKASAQEYKDKLDLLHKKISSIFRFSRSGNLMRARQYCERAEKAVNNFSGKDRSGLDERLDEARKALGDMGDWKNFATEPKYIELCEAMERLETSKLHPDKLSKELKQLQQQWKTLGHSDISDQYWTRFKEAADKVYQPCAEFFNDRHKVRQSNLEQRRQIVEQMRELLDTTDWDNSPDYKQAQNTVRSISDQFAEIKDVERGAGQKQWKVFSQLKDEVYAKLNVAYEANIELKQQLIKQVTALAETAGKEENLAALKLLQTRWKQVGVTRRNADQKAWIEFKKQGDIVFEHVQLVRQGKKDETDSQLNAYREIIKDIKKLARAAKDLAEADHQFTELQDKYSSLPELPSQLPEKLVEGIQRDYQLACDQFDNSHTRIIQNMHARQVDALRLKADLCVQLEALGSSAPAQKLQEIAQQWDVIELQDTELSRRIEQRRDSAQTIQDRTEITAQRRLLCIQLEIAMGKESPAEDKALRMQYQLEQMNEQGLGGQAINNSEQLERMELDWLCKPGAEANQQKQLDERFQRILRADDKAAR